MTCQECIEKLHLYLDRELSEQEQHEVQRHLAFCKHCADAFKFERGMLHRVGDSCRTTTASAELRTRIRVLVQTTVIVNE